MIEKQGFRTENSRYVPTYFILISLNISCTHVFSFIVTEDYHLLNTNNSYTIPSIVWCRNTIVKKITNHIKLFPQYFLISIPFHLKIAMISFLNSKEGLAWRLSKQYILLFGAQISINTYFVHVYRKSLRELTCHLWFSNKHHVERGA